MPDPQIFIFIAVIIVLMICSAISSGVELAFSTVNVIRIRQFAKNFKTRKKANRVLSIVDKYDQFLATILILNNIFNILMSALTTYLFTVVLAMGSMGVLIGTVVVTVLLVTFSEIMPKNLAKRHPEAWTMKMNFPVVIAMRILSPITHGVAKMNKRLISDDHKPTATEQELIDIVETIEKEGVLEQDESELIQKAIIFDSKTIQSIMRKKEEVYSFLETTSLDEAIAIANESNYSRFPVLSVTTGKVIGVVNDKELFKAEGSDVTLPQLMKRPIFISYRRLLPAALAKLQRARTHLAIVVDNLTDREYQGIVTLEDILEELVGEIYDEHDELPKGIVTYGHHTFVVDGDLSVSSLFEVLDEADNPYYDKNVDLWVRNLFRFKGIKVGETVRYDNLIIKILEIEKGRKVQDRKNIYIKRVEIIEETKI